MKKVTASKNAFSLASEYALLREDKKRAEKRMAEIKKELVDTVFDPEMAEGETEYEASSSGVSMSYNLVATTRFDSASFKRDNPDVYSNYTKNTHNKVFSVSLL